MVTHSRYNPVGWKLKLIFALLFTLLIIGQCGGVVRHKELGAKVGCRLMAARINMLIKTGNWKSSTDRDK